jgi:sulfur carrier protein
MIEIYLNGEPRQLPADCSVLALLELEGLAQRRVAVERNGEIVPRSLHAQTSLANGDRIEVVHAMGGG